MLGLYLLYRGLRQRAYFSGLGERCGALPFPPSTGMGPVWLHAVSVGEVLSAVALVKRIKDLRPDLDVYISTSTLAGKATARERFADLAKGVFYAPLDYVSVVRRVLRRVRPSLVIVMETEIWPNLYREAKRAGAQLWIVNGRISDRALPKYRRRRWFFRHVLALPDAIWAQSPRDAERFIAAGAPPDRIHTGGNLKYDLLPPAEIAADLQTFLKEAAPAQTWIAASTMPPAVAGDPDEDDAVIAAFLESQKPGLLLILAPRKPERFDLAAEKLRAAGIRFVRRSELASLELPGVLLLDSIGELSSLFEYADLVFMGGTLASRGGHNILEPAYFGKPVVAGRHMENFAEIAAEFDAAGALVRVSQPTALGAALRRVSAHPEFIGEKGRSLAYAKRGVADRLAALLVQAADEGVPAPLRTLPARLVLRPLACLWALGNRVNLWMARADAQSLATRVVSIGGITMGGSGKTPLVAHIASRLSNPAILTRGYQREFQDMDVIVNRGAKARIAKTGDEAQLFVRRGIAHVGIGEDRLYVGQQMEGEIGPDIFLLDDGFQHVQLERKVDIVAIDVENPWGGGLFPLGLRREPLTALARATAIVLTRVPRGANATGIEKIIRRYNPTAPIFRSRMVPEPWDGPLRVAAFCGIGSPSAFWKTLDGMGLDVVHRASFPDHQRYMFDDLYRVCLDAQRAGAEVLVTTEKDMMNLPDGMRLPLGIRSIRISVEIENEQQLINLVEGIL
ncbi:MAG: tetraacyldisaccharide 4'-kinase [Acidobacteriota bacterium]